MITLLYRHLDVFIQLLLALPQQSLIYMYSHMAPHTSSLCHSLDKGLTRFRQDVLLQGSLKSRRLGQLTYFYTPQHGR